MEVIIVGGDPIKIKYSSIIDKIAELLPVCTKFNGGIPRSIEGYDLTIWMPDISNDEKKFYPVKDVGSVLICSKVMREGYTHIDSVTRIFNMHGNAVIEIYKTDGLYEFELRDALNHCWCDRTSSLPKLVIAIMEFYKWSKKSIRRSLTQKEYKFDVKPYGHYQPFIDLNKRFSLKVANGCGNRYFGNYSTRCTKLFPSVRDEYFLFSPRNVNKEFVTLSDLVLCDYDSYYGTVKPSVDTPVQLEIYKKFPRIKYMIHGHAYIKNCPVTKSYTPCGDLRETKGVLKVLKIGFERINLLNHGFIICSDNLERMMRHYAVSEFREL